MRHFSHSGQSRRIVELAGQWTGESIDEPIATGAGRQQARPCPLCPDIVSWPRYAELFAMTEQSETFSLENPHEARFSRSQKF
jgi:hypothetical protein